MCDYEYVDEQYEAVMWNPDEDPGYYDDYALVSDYPYDDYDYDPDEGVIYDSDIYSDESTQNTKQKFGIDKAFPWGIAGLGGIGTPGILGGFKSTGLAGKLIFFSKPATAVHPVFMAIAGAATAGVAAQGCVKAYKRWNKNRNGKTDENQAATQELD